MFFKPSLQQAHGFSVVKWNLLPLGLAAMKPLAVTGVGWITNRNGRDTTETEAQPSIIVCVDGDEEKEAEENIAACLVPQFLLNLGKRRSFNGTQ